MEGSIIIAKSGSNVINLDAVQCGVAKEKNVVKFFAKAVQKVKQKLNNTVETAPIKIEDIENNILVEKEDKYVRMVVKDKKAKIIKNADFKPDRIKKLRIDEQFIAKYGKKKDVSKQIVD